MDASAAFDCERNEKGRSGGSEQPGYVRDAGTEIDSFAGERQRNQ